MSILYDAMKDLSVNPTTHELIVPAAPPPLSEPEGSEATVNTVDGQGNITSVNLANGFVASVQADGSLLATKTDADGNVIEQQTYVTTQDADGVYGVHMVREWYDAKGRFITDDVQQSGTGNVMAKRSKTIQGVEDVQLAQYEADWNGKVVNASYPSIATYAGIFAGAKSTFDAQGLTPVEEVTKLAAFATELGQAELDFANRLGVSPDVLRPNLAVAYEGLAKSIANAYDGFTAKYLDPLFAWGTTVTLDTLRAFQVGLDAALTAVSGSAEAAVPESLHDDVAASRALVDQAAQTIAILPGRGGNPFDDPTFDPDAVLTGNLAESGTAEFSAYLPYEAGSGGQLLNLTLAGADANKLAVAVDGQRVALDAGGSFTLVIAEGQRESSFEIVSDQDVDASSALTLSGQLVDGAGNVTHLPHQELSLTLQAFDETIPTTSREIRGDWAFKLYTDPTTGDTYYKFDDLGNVERDPGVPNTGDQQPDATLHGSSGPDHIVSGDFDTQVDALAGDDYVMGSENEGNAIYGGEGSDRIEGGGFANHQSEYDEFDYLGRTIKLGDDKIYSGAGDDQVWGESEATQAELFDPATLSTGLPGDWISGGTGDDRIYGSAGDDVLLGGTGGDLLVGGPGMDVLIGDDDYQIRPDGNYWRVLHPNFGDSTPGFGNFEVGLFPVINYYPNISSPDSIFPSTGDPYFTYYQNGGGADTLIGGGGDDILIGQAGDDKLDGGDGNDILAGWEGNDELIGGAGDDLMAGDFGRYEQPFERQVAGTLVVPLGLVGSHASDGATIDQTGDDFLDGGAGNDILYGEGGDDSVLGGDGNDRLYGDAPYLPNELHGADILDGGAGDDFLDDGAGDDKLYGGAGMDELHGGLGNDLLDGGTEDDTLFGDDGNDELHGGAGNDVASGGGGDDVLFGGEGNDTLQGDDGADALYGESGADTLEGGAGDDVLYGGSGDDLIDGGDGNDVINGGAGIDIVRGGAGDDTYILGLGYGQDVIEDAQGQSYIRFSDGVLSQDLKATLDQASLVATLDFDSVGDFASLDMGAFDVATVQFASGETWGKTEFLNVIPALISKGSSGSDVLVGRNTLRNDLQGGGGNDIVIGSANRDSLTGGDGADVLDGRSGSDTYFFDANETGIDRLSDSGVDGAAYVYGYYSDLGIDSTDVDYRSQFGGKYRVDAAGEGGSQTYYFDTYDEAIAAYPGGSIAYVEPLPSAPPLIRRDDSSGLAALIDAGAVPRDVVQFGSGLSLGDLAVSVKVNGASASAHPEQPWYDGGTLSVRWGAGGFDLAVPSVTYGFSGTDLIADGDPSGTTAGAWRGYKLGEGIETFEFADGSSYSLEQLLQQASVVLANTYEFVRGSGVQTIDSTFESVEFASDIVPSEVSGQRDGQDLVFQLSDYSAQGRIVDWYADPATVPQMSFEFADGTTFDTDTVTRLGLTQYGSAGYDYLQADPDFASALYGMGGGDDLSGGAGNDLLDPGPDAGGEAYLDGGAGNDIYVFGVGYGWVGIDEDKSDGGTGIDTVRFGSGIAPQDVSADRSYGDLVLTVGASGDTLDIFRWLDASGGSVELFEFADGTVWDGAAVAAMLPGPDAATAGDDLLYGTLGDDTLDGLGGNDEVVGFAGNDTLYGGDGNDYVEGGAGIDLLYGGAGIDDVEDWTDASLLDVGAGDDYTYDEGGDFVIGGAGDDWIDHYGDGGVIAFNPGDGNDTVQVEGAVTLSIGGGAQPADLSLGQNGSDLVIDVAGTDSIRLTTSNPAAWPAITLQMFGSVHEYDFNAVIADYETQAAGDPTFVLSLDGVLQAHETATSSTDALGGAIAWQYATTGSTAALSLDDLRTVLSDPNFGFAAQPISLVPPNSAPTLDAPIADQTTNEDSAFSFTLPAGTFSDPDAGDTLTYGAALVDGSALPAWLSFDAGTQTFTGTPLQVDVGAIDLRVTATDGGGLSAEDSFTLNVANVNDAPVVAAADAELLLGDAAAAASLFSVADEDGDIPVQYELWDDVAGGGYFSVNGVAQNAGAAIAVSAADLANAEYVAGSTPGIERVWARAYDGQAWSAWTGWNMTSALHIPDAAPEATPAAATQTVLLDAAAGAATLFSVGDSDGDPVVQYQFWDDVDGGGYFAVNGLAQAAGAAITVDAADLTNTQYVGGSASGAETVWVRATDGQLWGAWKSWAMRSWPHAANSAPVATAADGEVLRNASVAAASLFSISDADGDPVTQYELWDDTAGGGYFSVAGVAQDTNPIPVDAAQLADVSYVGGADPGVEQVWVRASDGLEWGAWTGWHMTTALHIPDAAPEATPIAAAQTVLLGQAVDASTLFGVSDADGDPVASYELFDSTPGGGHFALNGVEQGVNVAIPVSAAELASTQFVASADIASDQVWVRATDGQSWGAWKSWTMNSWPHATNSAPVADAAAGQVLQNEAVAAATLFSVSDADADPVTQYEFWDDVNGGGSFRVNGVQQAAGQAIAVSAADLANTEYVGGANPGTEQVWVRASDGMQWGAWNGWNMTTALHLNDAAPVVATSTRTALLGQAVDAASLFSVSDADGDPIASYEFFDSTAGGGHFTVNGVEQGVNVSIPVSAADLASARFVAADDIASDQLWVRATDGQLWGDWKSWTQNSWPHLADSAPVASAGSAGVLENEALPVSMFFSTSDADGDPVARYEFWDDVNGGGYFRVDGVQRAAGQAIPVSAADLANVDYVGGAEAGAEQVWVRASDGMQWGAWKNWLMSTEGGALRGGSGPDTLNGDPSTPILEGGGGDDNLTAGDVNSLLSGGSGNDTETGGAGNDLLAGGAGDDTISTGGGDNVVVFNAGDGVDTVYSDAGAQNTLSFGGGVTYDDLSLSKNGNDLIVNVGQNDKVVLKDWYAGYDNVLSLQIVLDATNQFDPNSSDPLYNNKVETFDFAGLVNEFDQALAQSPGLTSWQVTNALLQFHLTGSDDAAIGGDLAYWYGKNGGFSGISVTAAQQIIGAAGFGSDAQALHPFSGLQDGFVKLA